MPPVFGGLAKQFKAVFARTIDVFREPELAREFGVRAIPTTLFVRSGREIERFEGPVSERTLRFYLERLAGEYEREHPEIPHEHRSAGNAALLTKLGRLFRHGGSR